MTIFQFLWLNPKQILHIDNKRYYACDNILIDHHTRKSIELVFPTPGNTLMHQLGVKLNRETNSNSVSGRYKKVSTLFKIYDNNHNLIYRENIYNHNWVRYMYAEDNKRVLYTETSNGSWDYYQNIPVFDKIIRYRFKAKLIGDEKDEYLMDIVPGGTSKTVENSVDESDVILAPYITVQETPRIIEDFKPVVLEASRYAIVDINPEYYHKINLEE